MKDWTAKDDDEILRLLSQGQTRKQIAVHFGVTRNAICGRVHRLGKPQEPPMVDDEEMIIEFEALLAADPVFEIATPEYDPAHQVKEVPRMWVDDERVSPDRIPRDADSFWAWMDFACVEWNERMMKEGWYAWEHLKYRKDDTSLQVFLETYRGWYLLSEPEKFALMFECQRESRLRRNHLARARNAVLLGPRAWSERRLAPMNTA